MKRLQAHERYTAIGIAFILSGALGNVIDRIIYGYVIDFVQYYYSSTESCLLGFSFHRDISGGECIWPAFNVADTAISIGAGFLILELIRDTRRHHKQKQVAE